MTEENSTNPQSTTNQPETTAEKLCGLMDALLFVADRPLTLQDFENVLTEFSKQQIKEALETLTDMRQSDQSGVELVQVVKGYQYRTKSSTRDWITRFLKAKPSRLSRAALESLSIIAYRQPITRPEVDEIRGVDSSGVVRMLLERGLVRILGKKDEPGHPLLYGTTRDFLSFFNLNNLSDLPPLQEYTELGEDSLKKLESMFPDHDPNQIEKRVEDPSIMPLDAEEEQTSPSTQEG